MNAPPDTTKPGSYAYYPSTSSILVANGGTYARADATMVIKLQAWDNSGVVDHISYQIDGGSWRSVVGSGGTISVNGFGAHALSYYAVDASGNTETAKNVAFTIVAP